MKNSKHHALLMLAPLFLWSGCTTADRFSAAAERRFDFALIGDVPYTDEQVTTLFPNMIRALNAVEVEFVVHDGDIKSGASPCNDSVFEDRLRDFNSFRHPLVYLFGDNEWTDCGRTNGFDPEERLQKLRDVFARGDQSLGQRKIPLARQSNEPRFAKFRENVRWEMGNVMFVGLNVPGSVNNYGNKAEFTERNAANIAWIKESFAFAKVQNRRALMLILQANPFPELGSTNRVHSGFKEMLEVLEKESLAFEKPVVFVHGDSHNFRIDKPLYGAKSHRRIENFTRVETFGNPDVHWVRATVDPRDPNVFTFRPQLVKENLVQHDRAKAVNAERE